MAKRWHSILFLQSSSKNLRVRSTWCCSANGAQLRRSNLICRKQEGSAKPASAQTHACKSGQATQADCCRCRCVRVHARSSSNEQDNTCACFDKPAYTLHVQESRLNTMQALATKQMADCALQVTHPGVTGLISVDVEEGTVLVLCCYALILASECLQQYTVSRCQHLGKCLHQLIDAAGSLKEQKAGVTDTARGLTMLCTSCSIEASHPLASSPHRIAGVLSELPST